MAIPKNLKVGETFTDGGNKYKVVEIVAEGYISKIVKTEEPTEEVAVVEKKTRRKVQ